MKTCAMLFALTLLATSAFARLGESKKQCEERYGKPDNLPTHQGIVGHSYKKDGITINAEFYGDKCIRISYRVSGRFMTPDLVNTLLSANQSGGGWRMLRQSKNENGAVVSSDWLRGDGAKAEARDTTLTLTVANYQQLLKQADQEHSKKVGKGF